MQKPYTTGFARHSIATMPFFGKHLRFEAPNDAGSEEPPKIEEKKPDPAPEPKKPDPESKPSDAEAKLLKEVMEKKNKLKEKEDALEAANERLKAFEGIDPAVARKLLAEQAAAEAAQLEAKGEFERVKQMMIEAHKAEKEALSAAVAEREEKLTKAERTIADLTVGAAFSQSNFISEDLVLTPAKARQIYGSHCEVENGRVVVYDKPIGESNRTKLVNGSGDALSFEEGLKKLVEMDPDRESLLRSKLAPGAGDTGVDTKAKPQPNTGSGLSRIAQALNARKK